MAQDALWARALLRDARKPLDEAVAQLEEQILGLEKELLKRRMSKHGRATATAVA